MGMEEVNRYCIAFICTPSHLPSRIHNLDGWARQGHQARRGRVRRRVQGRLGYWEGASARLGPVRCVPHVRSAGHAAVPILNHTTIRQALQHGVDEVAVKKIRSLSPSLAQLRTFHYEVDCLRRLCHRNIVQVR